MNMRKHTLENLLRFDREKLYGRDHEIAILKQKFERCKRKKQIVVIQGEGGSGKTVLVTQSLEPLVHRHAGFFLGGKFSIQQGNKPYGALLQIIQRLTNALLVHKFQPNSNKWQFSFEEIVEALQTLLTDDCIDILTRTFPDLTELLVANEKRHLYFSDPNKAPRLDYTKSKQRLNHSFRSFVRILTDFGRVVFLLDDLQWADMASLDLVQSIVADADLKDVLIIGCLRPEGLLESSPFSRFRASVFPRCRGNLRDQSPPSKRNQKL